MAMPRQRAILCPNCQQLLSAETSQCPHCGIMRPGAWWRRGARTLGAWQPKQVLRIIMALNIVMYILALCLRPPYGHGALSTLSFLAPTSESLLLLGATGTLPIDRLHRWWSLVSANYLHGGILHIVFNMIALGQIGLLVIQAYGVSRMLILYTLCGILGFWVSYLAGVPLTIGASAAVCGLIGATLYYGKNRGGIYGQALYRQIGSWALMIFFFGFVVPGINNWGHGGGMGAGWMLGMLLGYQERQPEQGWHILVAYGCIVVTIAVLGWAVISGLTYHLSG